MNRRGQIFILGAIILSLAIFSVVKVTNTFEGPSKDNFDFFVENFEGEKAYVMNLGYLQDRGGDHYLKDLGGGGVGLLETFQDFGINVGIVLVEYTGSEWVVTNYLGEIVNAECDECETFAVQTAGDVAEVSFSLDKGGRKWIVGEGAAGSIDDGSRFFTHTFEGNPADVRLVIGENKYEFTSEGGDKKVEGLLFRNLDENYVKVVQV